MLFITVLHGFSKRSIGMGMGVTRVLIGACHEMHHSASICPTCEIKQRQSPCASPSLRLEACSMVVSLSDRPSLVSRIDRTKSIESNELQKLSPTIVSRSSLQLIKWRASLSASSTLFASFDHKVPAYSLLSRPKHTPLLCIITLVDGLLLPSNPFVIFSPYFFLV